MKRNFTFPRHNRDLVVASGKEKIPVKRTKPLLRDVICGPHSPQPHFPHLPLPHTVVEMPVGNVMLTGEHVESFVAHEHEHQQGKKKKGYKLSVEQKESRRQSREETKEKLDRALKEEWERQREQAELIAFNNELDASTVLDMLRHTPQTTQTRTANAYCAFLQLQSRKEEWQGKHHFQML